MIFNKLLKILLKMSSVLTEIKELYLEYGSSDYIGENVTQTSHMIQTAMNAELDGADRETIIAAFLHDIGHLIGLKEKLKGMDEWGVENHEKIGSNYLRNANFPEKICKLVQNHVNAKRYLVTIYPEYYNELSHASKKTLEYQGGRMTDQELYEFDNDPLKKIYLQFRKWEDCSKVQFVKLDPIEKYFEMINLLL